MKLGRVVDVLLVLVAVAGFGYALVRSVHFERGSRADLGVVLLPALVSGVALLVLWLRRS